MGAMLPPMRELFPVPGEDVDPVERYAGDDRTPPAEDRPWVLVNMIATVDGATAVEGRSGGLGGPADKLVFRALRAVADVILVGAGTVRAESYGTPQPMPGRPTPPRLAIVTQSLELDVEARVFTEAPEGGRPFVVTSEASDPVRRAELSKVAELVLAGRGEVDLGTAVAQLAARGARVVLCEGGPSLNGHLISAGVIDEMCVSLAPLLAAGSSPRVAHGSGRPVPHTFSLDRVLESGGYLFLRYVRRAELSGASAPSPS
jgi:riboflavin biosynthesis pyrimidine reductase